MFKQWRARRRQRLIQENFEAGYEHGASQLLSAWAAWHIHDLTKFGAVKDDLETKSSGTFKGSLWTNAFDSGVRSAVFDFECLLTEPVRVLEYRLSGGSVKVFICRPEGGRTFQTSVENIEADKAVIEARYAVDLADEVKTCEETIGELTRQIAECKAHPLWKP